MFDLPNGFWYTLAISIIAMAWVVLWLHSLRCKKKRIEPALPFAKIKPRTDGMSRKMDVLWITLILLETIAYGYYMLPVEKPSSAPTPELQYESIRISLYLGLLLTSCYSGGVVLMAGFLSFFQTNITLLKRLLLLMMSCVPLVCAIVIYTVEPSSGTLKFMAASSLPLIWNSPAILLGRTALEYFDRLIRKISTSWFPQTKK